MADQLDLITEKILKLSRSERVELLERLAVSLNFDPKQEAEWDALADERERSLLEDTAKLMPLDEVLARLRAKFSE